MDFVLCHAIRTTRNIYALSFIYTSFLATLNNKVKNKWYKYYNSDVKEPAHPSDVLFFNQHLLPKNGIALDLACGYGSNAICLAKNRLRVTAWDISESALEKLSIRSKQLNLRVDCEVRDILKNPPQPNTFDVIVVSKFLDRELIKNIKNAIKSNGLIFYQTFTKSITHKSGPKNPNYKLDDNELLEFFSDWKLIFYKEEGEIGDLKNGIRNQAMIVSQKK